MGLLRGVSDAWLTVNQAAKAIGLGRRTIYRLMALGRLPYHLTPTGRRRVRRADLEAWTEPVASAPPFLIAAAPRIAAVDPALERIAVAALIACGVLTRTSKPLLSYVEHPTAA